MAFHESCYFTHRCTFGITAVASTSRRTSDSVSPSLSQSSARHHCLWPHRALSICLGCGEKVTWQAGISTVRRLPRESTRCVRTKIVVTRARSVLVTLYLDVHETRDKTRFQCLGEQHRKGDDRPPRAFL